MAPKHTSDFHREPGLCQRGLWLTTEVGAVNHKSPRPPPDPQLRACSGSSGRPDTEAGGGAPEATAARGAGGGEPQAALGSTAHLRPAPSARPARQRVGPGPAQGGEHGAQRPVGPTSGKVLLG